MKQIAGSCDSLSQAKPLSGGEETTQSILKNQINMKNNLYRVALLAALGLAGISAAQAGTPDLLLGFNDAAGPAGAQNDFVIDLGNVNTLGGLAALEGGSVNVWNNSIGSTFTTAFGADGNYDNDVAVGAVEGYSASYPKTLFQTGLTGSLSLGKFNNSVAAAQSPTVGEYASTSQSGWSWFVAVDPNNVGNNITGGDVANQTGNPLEYLNGGSVTLTLWETTLSSATGTPAAWQNTDQGSFLIDPDAQEIIFTATPEPSTFGLLALGGLLVLSLRHRINRINA
jgi:hypothetical protein